MALQRKVTLKAGNQFISIKDALDDFVADKETVGLASKTIKNYLQSIDYFVEFEFDGDYNIEVSEISKIFVEQYKASMIKDNMRITTLNHYIRDLRTFLYWCMDDERAYITPAFKIECVKGQEALPKIFTDEEVDIILQKPNNVKDWVEWRNWAISNWAVATGNRAQTICELKIGDIDFNNQEITLRHTKTKKAEVVPLSPALEGVMKLYIRKCRSGCSKDEWLFPNISNEQMTYNALAHSFAKYCKSRGVAHTNIHGLRHYFGTTLTRKGYSGEKLQKLLGHSTYSTTQRYIKLSGKDLKEGYDSYNPLDTIKRSSKRTKKVTIK